MTEFAGWRMPLRYGSETTEHNAVRTNAALFDLSHMGEIAVTGPGAGAALDYAVCGWPSRLSVGRARYTMICAPDGGILDDLIIYRQAEERFLVVANAANISVVLGALRERVSGGTGGGYGETESPPGAVVTDESEATGLISIQGPNGIGFLSSVTNLPLDGMAYYAGAYGKVAGREAWVARTGYTGEDGFEISVPAGDAPALARRLLAEPEVAPAGLGARDSLRLEAGLCLYGHELTPDTNPVEANLAWTIARRRRAARDFPGAEPILQQLADGPARKLVGIRPDGRAPAREGTEILDPAGGSVGAVTSGGFGPTVGGPIALGYVRAEHAAPASPLQLLIRGKPHPARVVELPFVPHRYHR
jgi:aminomethyltransferase